MTSLGIAQGTGLTLSVQGSTLFAGLVRRSGHRRPRYARAKRPESIALLEQPDWRVAFGRGSGWADQVGEDQ
jgi:hypothetical protein